MTTIAILGTLDTKAEEHAFLQEFIRGDGADVLMIDTGLLGAGPSNADVSADEVARAAGVERSTLVAGNDRSAAIDVMGRGAGKILKGLLQDRRLDGVISLGGGSGTTLASIAMRALPVGMPKLIVSTIASGNTRPIVRGTDLTLTYPVVDIAGLNHVTRRILVNAAGAIVGMARAYARAEKDLDREENRPVVAMSMFGVTSTAGNAARAKLEKAGFDVLVFHATGSGGESMEALIEAGLVAGVLDLTTTELADDLLGGVMSAGPDRLTAAAKHGVPQVVSVGALDMVNLGPLDSLPEAYKSRRLHQHAPTMTLMRTSPEDCVELGRRLVARVNLSSAAASIYIPLRGTSSASVDGAPFFDPEADASLFEAIRSGARSGVKVVELDASANDPLFGEVMADALIEYIQP